MRDEAMRRLRAANPVPSAPPILAVDDLIAGWPAEATLGPAAPGEASRRNRSGWRATGLSVVLALLIGTGSAAAALTAFTGRPLPQSADSLAVHPAAATTHVSDVRAADPDGGPPWALRLGTAPGNLQCLGVGQIDDGQLGIVGLDGVFRAVEPAGADDCGVPPRPDAFTVASRTFLGNGRGRTVTLIYGVRGAKATSVTVTYRGGQEKLKVGPDGGFVFAHRGTLASLYPSITVGVSGAHYLRGATLGPAYSARGASKGGAPIAAAAATRSTP